MGALLGLLVVLAPEVASAQTKVRLTPASGPPGARVSLKGSGFARRSIVRVTVRGKRVARVRASRRGSFRARARIPRKAKGRVKLLSRARGRRVVSLFKVRRSPNQVEAAEMASGSGTRVRTEPYRGSPGSVLRVSGAGFPRKKPVQITFGGNVFSAGASTAAGAFAHELTVPALPAGAAQIAVRVGSKALRTTFSVVVDPLVVAAGDIACDPESPLFNGGNGTATACHMKQTASLVQSLGPDIVALLGDAQYEAGTPPDFRASYDRTWGAFKSITRPVIGDHEYGHQDGAGYFEYFGTLAGDRRKSWYSYDLGAWHVVAFNGQCGEAYVTCAAGTAQERWLRADLAANSSRCVLAYTHSPLYTSATSQPDPHIRPLFRALLDAGVDVVLGGDSHNYERFAPQNLDGKYDPAGGIRQFVVGTGGRDLRPFGAVRPNSEVRNADTFGILALSLHPGSYDWHFVPEPGRTFTDAGSQACH